MLSEQGSMWNMQLYIKFSKLIQHGKLTCITRACDFFFQRQHTHVNMSAVNYSQKSCDEKRAISPSPGCWEHAVVFISLCALWLSAEAPQADLELHKVNTVAVFYFCRLSPHCTTQKKIIFIWLLTRYSHTFTLHHVYGIIFNSDGTFRKEILYVVARHRQEIIIYHCVVWII